MKIRKKIVEFLKRDDVTFFVEILIFFIATISYILIVSKHAAII